MNFAQHFEDIFPFKRRVSLRKLIQFWETLAASGNDPTTEAAQLILRRVSEYPELTQDTVDSEVLARHSEILDLLMSAVFPIGRTKTIAAAAFPPFGLECFYATSRFTQLDLISKFLHENMAHGCNLSVEDMIESKVLSAYHLIATHFYDLDLHYNQPLIVSSPDEKTGLNKYYQVDIDTSFVDIRNIGELPVLTEKDRVNLSTHPDDLELWKALLPPDRFEYVGFVVMNAVDVSDQAALSQIRNVLLKKESLVSPETIDQLELLIREMLQKPDLRLGLISLDRCHDNYLPSARSVGRSLLIENSVPECSAWSESYYARAIASGAPLVVRDLENDATETGYEWQLRAKNIRNAMIAPLRIGDEVIGILELMSPNVGDIAHRDLTRMSELISLFAAGLKRQVEIQEDRVEAVIKRQYTAIHPVVEWRFRKAALRFLDNTSQNKHAEAESIVFERVHALYGLSDIRDSSIFRNDAIRADLTEQLGLALRVIIAAATIRPLPSLDELGYRINRYAEELAAGLRTGDEHSIIMLLQTEVEPLFESLISFSSDVAGKVEEYRLSLSPELGILYQRRKHFEQSVTQVNESISSVLEKEGAKAQRMIPHFFEKFQTDGVDYNMYAGASLLENGEFNPLDLKNLKIWQLSTMAEIVWEMDRIKPLLEIPLSTAHLILVQAEPISVRFRIDEKKFDVDGAYNIRYEIIKKRIDKSVIAGTDERLTQPGKVAIVYSHDEEASEYTRYLDYLTAAGYFEPGIERLDLAPLHGVSGLKALRVSVTESLHAADSDMMVNVETEAKDNNMNPATPE